MIHRGIAKAIAVGLCLLLSTGCGIVTSGVPAGALTLMEGRINERPARFVVDSGSPSTLLAQEKVHRYGVHVGAQTGLSGGIGGLVPRHSAVIDSWSFGGQRGGPTFIQVQTMPFARENGGPDGLAGLDLLETLGVVLDYSNRLGYGELIVDLDGAGSARLARQARAHGWTEVPLIRRGNEEYHLMAVVLAGEERLWLVDTGAQRGLIDLQFARQLGLRPRATANRIIGATGHMARSQQVDAVPLTLPDGSVYEADLVVLDPDTLGSEPPEAIRFGLLGADVLNAAGAIYDIANAVIYLPPAR